MFSILSSVIVQYFNVTFTINLQASTYSFSAKKSYELETLVHTWLKGNIGYFNTNQFEIRVTRIICDESKVRIIQKSDKAIYHGVKARFYLMRQSLKWLHIHITPSSNSFIINIRNKSQLAKHFLITLAQPLIPPQLFKLMWRYVHKVFVHP